MAWTTTRVKGAAPLNADAANADNGVAADNPTTTTVTMATRRMARRARTAGTKLTMAMMTTTTMSKTLPTQAYNDDKYNGHAEYRTNEDGAAARNLWSEKRLNKYGTAPHAYGQQSRDNDDAGDHRRAATTKHDSLYAQMKFQQNTRARLLTVHCRVGTFICTACACWAPSGEVFPNPTDTTSHNALALCLPLTLLSDCMVPSRRARL